MKRLIFSAALLAATPTLAQVPPGAPPIPPSPLTLEQLVRERLGAEILAGLSCQAGSAAMKSQLEAAQARIKELEARPPEAPKK